MRLDEIISSNQIIINLRKMRIEFSDEFSFISATHIFFAQSSIGKSRHRILHGNISSLRADIVTFLDYDFDPDPDIDQLKIEANNILNELVRIEREIP
jgi:hypothetical protein